MQTRKRSDFIVGIVALFAIVTLILGVMWLKGNAFHQKRDSYTALFTQVGGLQVGDPVMLNGIRVGTINTIALHNVHVAVTFAISDSLKLYEGSTFTVMEMGLLGEKKLEIAYRKIGQEIAPNTKESSPFLIHGTYQNGVTETMGTINVLATKMIDLIDTVQTAVETMSGTLSGDGTFLPFLDTMMARLDTITRVTQTMVTENDSKINQIIENLHQASLQTRSLLDSNSSTITTVIHRSDSITLEMQSLLTKIDGIIETIDSGDGLASRLLKDTTFATDIDSTLQKFSALMDEMMGSGVKVRVRLGHRDRDKEKSKKDKKE